MDRRRINVDRIRDLAVSGLVQRMRFPVWFSYLYDSGHSLDER